MAQDQFGNYVRLTPEQLRDAVRMAYDHAKAGSYPSGQRLILHILDTTMNDQLAKDLADRIALCAEVVNPYANEGA